MKTRVADYIFQTIADLGVRHIFLITGGGAMHLNDAIAKEKRLTPIFNHHEQACTMGAEGYSRITNKISVVNVTTGPGGLNALNGVFGAYTDSIPMLIISGQVKKQTQRSSVSNLNLRQLGDQEVDIVNVVRPITKHVVSLDDPSNVKYELEKAIYLATHERPGPVWIDIPIDVQSALIETDSLKGFTPSLLEAEVNLDDQLEVLLEKLKSAKRPVLLVGNGIRLSDSIKELFALVEKLQIPLCSAWLMDFIPSDYKYFCGSQGTIGDRAGNFVVQNSDLLIVLGSRLQIRQISYNWENFAREAYKVHVDIDSAELNKPTLKNDLNINVDLKIFFKKLNLKLQNYQLNSNHTDWLKWAQGRKHKYYPAIMPKHRLSSKKINPYSFFEILSDKLDRNWNIVAGNASACVISFASMKIKEGQRVFTNAGSASMGYDLPAAIGAAIADTSRKTLCLAGDGSIMMNIQELQTVKQMNLKLKIIVINNNGYLSIRSTQTGFFGKKIGESPESGVTFPDFVNVAKAFGINAFRLENPQDIDSSLDAFIASDESTLLEVVVDEMQVFEPKLSSKKMEDGKMVSAPLEDMWPFLDRDEFLESMIINPMEVSKKL